VQYASLCLGALHATFGHMDKARQQIHEAMRIAQHHGDHRCVTHALAWLQHILFENNSGGNGIRSGGSGGSGGGGGSLNARNERTFEPSKASRLLVRAARRASDLGLPHLSALTAFTMAADGARGAPHNNNQSNSSRQGAVADMRSPNVASIFIEHGRTLLSAHLPSFSGANASMAATLNNNNRWYARPSYRAASAGDSETRRNHIDDPNSVLLIGDSFTVSRSAGGSSSSDGAGAAGPTSHGVHGLLSQRVSWRHGVMGLGGRAMLMRAYGWDLVGHKALSVATLRKQLCSYGAREGRTDDALAAMCMLSHAEACRSFFRVTEVAAGKRSSESLVVQALKTMSSARELLVSSVQGVEARRMWTHSACALLFDACVARGELERAEAVLHRAGDLCGVLDDSLGDFAAGVPPIITVAGECAAEERQQGANMAALSSPPSSLTRDALYADLQLRWCKLLIARGMHAHAYALANNRIGPYCRNRGFRFREVMSRVLAANACYEAMAAGGMGSEGALAMPSLVEAKRASHGLGLSSVESQLLVLQASIELLEGRSLHALRTLDRSWPHVLSHCSPQLQGGKFLFGLVFCFLKQIRSTHPLTETPLSFFILFLACFPYDCRLFLFFETPLHRCALMPCEMPSSHGECGYVSSI
jgi:hypothetical protein